MSRLTRPMSRRAISWLFGVPGCGLLALAGYLYLQGVAEMRSWQRTTGTVIGGQDFGSGNKRSVRSVVRFKTADGRETQLLSRSGSRVALAVGTTLPVVYDPADLGRARIDTVGELWWHLFVPGLPGLALTLVAVTMLATGRGRMHEPPPPRALP